MATKKQRKQRLAAGLCCVCGKIKTDDTPSCESCQIYNREYQRKRRARLINGGLCVTCGRKPARDKGKTCLECYCRYFSVWTDKNQHYRCKGLQQRLDRKRRVIDYYGGRCKCCSESGLIFLTIDHIYENGAERRRQIAPEFKDRVPGGDHFYRWLEVNEMPDGFQTLCYNCNIGKHRNGGVCPHQSGV